MRSRIFSRSSRRLFSATLTVAIVASVGTGIATRSAGHVNRPRAPQKVSISTALTAFSGANAFFLKISGIPGESTSDSHPNEITVNTVAWGVTSTGSSAGTSVKATFDNVQMTKPIDAASAPLMKATAQGTTFPFVVLTAQKNGTNPIDFVTLTLYNAKLTSFKETADEATGIHDALGFSSAKIRLTYTKQSSTGGASTVYTSCWDTNVNVAC